MIKKVEKQFIELSSGRNVIIFLIFFLIVSFIINEKPFGLKRLKEISGGVGIIDMEINYSPEKAYEILNNLGDSGRDFYLKRIIPVDFLFGLTYLIFLTLCILYFNKKTGLLNNKIMFLPFLTALFDYLENAMMIKLIVSFPDKLVFIAKTANIFTIFKFLFMICCYIIILIEIIMFFIKKIRK